VAGHVRIARDGGLPIATGENLHTLYEFSQMIRMGGVSYPEPAASAALGPDWQCSRLAFVFTTCSRARRSQAMAIQLAKIPVCGRLRT